MNLELDASDLDLLVRALNRWLAQPLIPPLDAQALIDLHRRLIVAYEQALNAQR